MSAYLAYWRTFWSDYWPVGAREHVLTNGYGSNNKGAISIAPGDNLWVVGRSKNDDGWRLLQDLKVNTVDVDETGIRRFKADKLQSRFFVPDVQEDLEPLLHRLTFLSGKRITKTDRGIGQQLQSVRPLSDRDASLLTSYADTIPSISSLYRPSQGKNFPSEEFLYAHREMTTRVRKPELSEQVKKLYDHRCQLCDTVIELPDGQRYAEAHHIVGLGNPDYGLDIVENMLCVCPNCHVTLDYKATRISFDQLTLDPKHKVDSQYIAAHNEKCDAVKKVV